MTTTLGLRAKVKMPVLVWALSMVIVSLALTLLP
jgi:hypothetical protein